jgi:hypothetical protein
VPFLKALLLGHSSSLPIKFFVYCSLQCTLLFFTLVSKETSTEFCGHFVAIHERHFVAIHEAFCSHSRGILWPFTRHFVAIHEAFCGHSRGMDVVWQLLGRRVVENGAGFAMRFLVQNPS